jgi:hypothetical protein
VDGRYKLVRLEELHANLPELVRWMGLKAALVPGVQRHNIGKREPYHWTRWNAKERETFIRWCGNLMDRFYSTWRAGNDWRGVKYHAPSGLLHRLKSNYEVVKRINAFFARNRPA